MNNDETLYNNLLTVIEGSPNVIPESIYNDNIINETNVMALVFSELFNYNDIDIAYFLRFKENDVYGGIQENAKYYDSDMKNGKGNAANNDKLTDIDLSYFNTQQLIKYYFLIDTISEIYGYLKKTEKRNNTITIKCRYTIRDGKWKLYQNGDYYTFNLTFDSNGSYGTYYRNNGTHANIINNEITSFKISNVTDESNVIVTNMCDVITSEIVKHLNYISNSDIAYSNAFHLENIETFYKFCRLKLKYRTLMCCRSINRGSVDIFIEEHFIHCFKNLRTKILLHNEVVHNSQNDVSNEILKSINSLEESNGEVQKHMRIIERNKRRINALEDTYITEILYAVFVIAIFFMSIAFIINGFNIQMTDKYILNGIIVMLSVLVYGMSYFMTKNYSVEKFQVQGQTEEIDNIEENIIANVENMITDISNNIIISALKKEDAFYLNKIDDVRIISRRSTGDLNNSIRENILTKKAIMFVANLFILSMVFIILGKKYSLWEAFYSIILSYLILFGIFIYDVTRIVQTSSYQYYWKKPSSLKEL
jgi:hypothetical protein